MDDANIKAHMKTESKALKEPFFLSMQNLKPS